MQKRSFILFIVLFFLFFVFKYLYLNLYTDFLWFESFGKAFVWLTAMKGKWIVFTSFFSFSFLFILFNYWIAQRISISLKQVSVETSQNPIADFVQQLSSLPVFKNSLYYPVKIYRIGMAVLLIFISSLFGISFQNYWHEIYLYFYQKPFHLMDPIFHKDVGFYIFSLPFFQHIYGYLFSLLVVTLLVSLWIYISKNILVLFLNGTLGFNKIKAHLFILFSALFGVITFGKWLKLYSILYSTHGVIFGAGYTEIHARLFGYKVMMVFALIAALLFLIYAFKRKGLFPFYFILLMIFASLLLEGLYPAMIQKFIVAPNELKNETPYISNTIQFTRIGYGLQNVEEVVFPVKYNLSYQDIVNNQVIINNIRLWNPEPLKQTVSQLQEIRPYYQFLNIDDDRYTIRNTLQQVYLSAREMDINQLPSQAQTWVNRHLVYTHGYGLCMSAVNEVTSEGLPYFLIKDFPPTSSIGITVTQPEIYFGEKTFNYVVVNTKEQEFHYPQGNDNVYNHYAGTGGILLDNLFKQLLFSINFGDLNLLISPQITSQSRILFQRDIKTIVRKIAPFLTFDSDPYLIVTKEGKLFWVLDAYTTSDAFPYSEPIQTNLPLNYIRNSVKIIINAYDGAIQLYVADPTDPILQAYAQIYPDLFMGLEKMPKDIQDHLRYPKDLFALQAEVFKTYHMTDPQVFYNREDIWDIPMENQDGVEQEMPPYYIVTQLPKEPAESYLLMLPFTPHHKNNMIAWLSVKCDVKNLGQLKVYQFPKERTIYGPVQLESRIDQDTEISQKLTLWGQLGSRVIRGNLMVIPVEESLIYVEPIYLQSTQSKLPEFKRVIFSYNDSIIMDETLDMAIRKTFQQYGNVPAQKNVKSSQLPETSSAQLMNLIKSLGAEFENFKNQAKNGNWVQFGEGLKTVDQMIQKLGRYVK